MPTPTKTSTTPRRAKAHAQPAITLVVPSTDLALGLPGETEEDAALISDAVARINGFWAAQGLETARAIGQYLIDTFFGGRLQNFHRRDGKHVSFRALADREDLRPSYSWLRNAVAVVEQWDLLPEDIRGAIPFTHQKLLLSLKDTEVKVKLAREVVEKTMGKETLAKKVQKLREKEGSKAGRPALPVFVKGLGKLRKAIAEATSEAVTAEAFATYSPKLARRLVEDVGDELKALQELFDRVRAAAEEFDASVRK